MHDSALDYVVASRPKRKMIKQNNWNFNLKFACEIGRKFQLCPYRFCLFCYTSPVGIKIHPLDFNEYRLLEQLVVIKR